MSRRRQTTRPGPAGVAAGLLLALAATSAAAQGPDDAGAANAECVLLAIEIVTEGEDTFLELATDGSPTSLGTRHEPEGEVVLDLTGCVPGPELSGGSFPTGPVSSLRLIQRSEGGAPVLAVAVTARQPFEHAVRSSPDLIEVRLQPRAVPPTSDGDLVEPVIPPAEPPDSAPEPPKRVRVLEPLPPAPAPPIPVPEAEAEADVSAVVAVAAQVERWARAWSDQRADDYLSAYALAFSPPGGASREAWERERRQRLTLPRFIEVALDALEVRLLEPGMAVASFWQSYTSDRYGDRVYKTQTWTEEPGGWKILDETVVTDPR